jgi:putative MATE family efflux protein
VSSAAAFSATQRMLHGPMLATLLRLATPNIVGLFAMTLLIGYDGYILGRLGADALAGIALVLPLSMLMLQMSAGGLGGATTAAVARALGAGEREQASRLAQHALLIALAAAAFFTLAEAIAGSQLYAAMGGRGKALADAAAYSGILFGGGAVIWLTNVLAAIVRGTGNMLVASLAVLATTAIHLVLCPVLVFGAGPVPAFGIAGAAASILVANAIAALAMVVLLLQPSAAVHLLRWRWRPVSALFRAILRVGLPASLNPVISNASIALATGYMGSFGTIAVAGYGVAARLEYILVPIAFGFGSALTAMVATNMGAGQARRAKQVTWAGAGIVLAVTGLIGVAAALWPGAWMGIFTTDEAVREAGSRYLRIVGGCYGFFGLGLALFFASQGAGRMLWPLAASTTRFAVIAVGGWICIRLLSAPPAAFFTVVALSFAAYALTLALAIRWSDWER